MNKATVKKFLPCIAVVVVAIVITFLLMWYSNGFESFKKLYVTANGAKLANELTLPKESKTHFEVKCAGFKLDNVGYSVTITPNVEYDFEYTVDGEAYKYSEAGELTEAFDVELHEGYFEISGEADEYSVEKVLKRIHSGKDVEFSEEIEPGKFYYSLTVSANKQTVSVPFRFHVYVTGIELDQPGITLPSTPANPTEPTKPTEPTEPTEPALSIFDVDFDFETLGWGGLSLVEKSVVYPYNGENVILINAKVKDEYSTQFKVSNIEISVWDKIDEIQLETFDLENGTFTLIPPCDGIYVITIYIVPTDM